MTNDKIVSELIGETAAHRDRAIAEAEEKKRAMWARIPRLAEVDGVLARTGSRIMAAAAAGGDVAARVSEIERENERLLAERAQLLASRGVAEDFDKPRLTVPSAADTAMTASRLRLRAPEAQCVSVQQKRAGQGAGRSELRYL